MSTEQQRRPVFAALVLALSLALAACGGNQDQKDSTEGDHQAQAKDVPKDKDGKPIENVKVPVEVATASRSAVTAAFQGTANLVPEAEADVVTKTSGVVLQIMVEEDDRVQAARFWHASIPTASVWRSSRARRTCASWRTISSARKS